MGKVSNPRWTQWAAALITFSFPNLSGHPAQAQSTAAVSAQNVHAQVRSPKVTLLSTMLVGDVKGIGEWGFSALVEADGRRVLLDTGSHPDTVLQNARDLKIDLSDVKEVILTHNHWDHVSGLMTLRKEMMKEQSSRALSRSWGPRHFLKPSQSIR
jgi:glyoxylase-like metal-dependent hydrolase (beta-lactamase superfamily II)